MLKFNFTPNVVNTTFNVSKPVMIVTIAKIAVTAVLPAVIIVEILEYAVPEAFKPMLGNTFSNKKPRTMYATKPAM